MKKLMITTSIMLCMILNANAATIYVDDNATGANDGTSFADAYTDLQVALDAAVDGDEIWIEYGIYRPTKNIAGVISGDRTATFYVNKNITIHGSFAGTESTLADRVLTAVNPITSNASNVTILSGDLDNDEGDINSNGVTYTTSGIAEGANNAYTVLHIGTGVSIGSLITGCVITAGAATNGSPTTTQDLSGAGVYNTGLNVILNGCYFGGNLAGLDGGGVYTTEDLTILNSSMFGCTAGDEGAGVYNNMSNMTLNAIFFVGNVADGNGGGIYNLTGSNPISSTIINCVFNDSRSNNSNGAAIYNNGTSNSITNNIVNSTFYSNKADNGSGGVMYNDGSVMVNIYNSIFNINSALTANTFFNNGATINVNLEYSLLQGSTATAESGGTGNITASTGMINDADPKFVNPLLFDFTLQTSSPAINAGDNAILVASGITTDLQSGVRFYCNTVDMGALERSNGKGNVIREKVIQLDGSSYVDVGSTMSGEFVGKSFTIEAWINMTAYDGGATDTETILGNLDGATGINFGLVGAADLANQGKLVLNIGGTRIIGSSVIPVGEWTHVAATFTNDATNTVTLYVNGKVETNSTAAPNVTSTSANTFIGYDNDNSNPINAQLEELRIWSDVRKMEEIQMNKRLLLPCGAENVLATYEFNNNVDNALELLGVAGDYDGTAVGTPTYPTSMIPLSLGNASRFDITGAGTSTHTGIDGSSLETSFGATNNPTGNIVVSYLNEDYSGTNPLNPTISGINGQYVIDNYGTVTTGLDYDLKFNVNDAADIDQAVTDYSLEKRGSDETGDWTVVATEATAISNTGGSKHLMFNVTGGSFSQFIVTEGNLLPVEMSLFTAILEGTQVNLDWQTASEEQNAGFFVQKSIDGERWENLGFVEGAGTTYEVQNYNSIDENPVNGINYYRLKQMDFDGKFEYSDIRTINYGDKQNAIAVYPNPVESQLIIEIPNNEENILVNIFDLTGRKVITQEIQTNQVQTNIDFSRLENGIYLLQINGNNWQKIEKVVVQH